jgi:phage terminase small subunit
VVPVLVAPTLTEEPPAATPAPAEPPVKMAPSLARQMPEADSSDPKIWLRAVMMSAETDPRFRLEAAKALLPYEHAKIGEGGKKEQQKDAAKKAASKFVAALPPKLAAAGGRTL